MLPTITPLSRYGERGAKGEAGSGRFRGSCGTVGGRGGRGREAVIWAVRDAAVKKVVDALRISDHNLVSLLLTTQRC
ncbi:enoyl-CoA hydratase [Burkholderia pseudomallei]|uniref:enoyl-CoA hydratase n=1 Tax=Burkholderia pseudomallei TaxID=28450 RepID=UPI00155A6800|nr:enoyl-CoA hydratase [Burkholderia pseudomallei]